MSDVESTWIKNARKGDGAAFNLLVDAYQRPVFNLCYRMLNDYADAEDAAQETFWRAYQNLSRYDEKRPFATWLLSIAAHYCIDQIRRRRIPAISLEDLPDETIPGSLPNPEKSLSKIEAEKSVQMLLVRLNPQDRAAIIMRYWYDFSDQEISDALGLTVSAVKSRLHRARRALAQAWIDQQETHEPIERRSYESPAI